MQTLFCGYSSLFGAPTMSDANAWRSSSAMLDSATASATPSIKSRSSASASSRRRRRKSRSRQRAGSDTTTSAGDPTASDAPGDSTTTAESPAASAAPLRRVRVSDFELCRRAAKASGRIDFDVLTDLACNRWRWRDRRHEFATFSIDVDAERRHEVLVAGDVRCSLEEAMGVLHTMNGMDLNATMSGLLKRKFIFGSVVHAISAAAAGAVTLQADVSPTNAAIAQAPIDNYVAVKTSTFVRPRLFVRNHHEWCFLESFERSLSGDSFVVSQSSIDANDLHVGKVASAHAHVDQLRDVSTAFYVERLASDSRRAVRMFFHAQYVGGIESFLPTRSGVAPPKTARAHLETLAKSVSRFSDVVRRRRLGIQIPANRFAFHAAAARTIKKNARCTCCTKRLLALVTRKKRCYLCAHFVCDHCWRNETMEMCNGHVAAILVCTRCLESVDACDFSEVLGPRSRVATSSDGTSIGSSIHNATRSSAKSKASSSSAPSTTSDAMPPTRTRYFLRVEPDKHDDNNNQDDNQDDRAPSRGRALVDILEQSLSDSDEVIQTAALSVIRHILKLDTRASSPNNAMLTTPLTTTPKGHESNPATSDDDDEETDERMCHCDWNNKHHNNNTNATASVTNNARALQTTRDHVDAITQCLTRAPLMPLSECVLANTASRSYPISIPATPASTVPDSPLPVNEAKRLDVIREHRLLELGEVTELNIICALAAQELGCAISMVTVIDRDDEHILACNASFLHRTTMARSQTFCSHLIMGNTPLLVRHPEADVRFHAMDAVTTHGIRFYCGFPLTARDGTVVGSVCCLDTQQRALTHSQYATMQTLARTASKVVRIKSDAIVAACSGA